MKRLPVLLLMLCLLVIEGRSQKKNQDTGLSTKIDISVTHPPSMEWIGYNYDTIVVDFNTLLLDLGIKSRLKLSKLEYYVNGVLEDTYAGYQLNEFERQEGDYNYVVNRHVILRPGLNEVRVVASNDKAYSSEIEQLIKVEMRNISQLQNEEDKTPPQILVSSPPGTANNVVRFSKGLISIQGAVIDESGIQSLNINGIKTPIKKNGNFIINLPLAYGENPVLIEVADVNGNTSLKRFVINRSDLDGEQYVPEEAKNYILAIGIDKYTEWPQLNNAVNDVDKIIEVLQDHYDYQSEHITVIKNEEATRIRMYDEMKHHIEQLSPNDNLFIYYSGHGYFDELLREGYWIPYDAELNASGDYLPNSSIVKVLQNLNCQHIFMVVDACFSGSLFASSSRGYVENVEKYKSRWALASGRLETVSDGELGGNSPFASTLIEYLKNNEKEKLAVSEIVQYMKVQVSEITQQTPLGNPLKNLGDEGGEFIFYRKD